MMQSKIVEFGEWLPDQPALGNSATVCQNVIPQAKSYRSIKGLSSFTNALGSRALSAFWVKDASNDFYNFAGDAGKLYRLSGNTFADVSKSGGYAVTGWEFAKWGERVIAASIDAPIQYFDVGTSTLFANLPGSPPQAKHIAIIKDFVFLGNLKVGSDFYPERIQWSGYNSSELWTPSLSTQADYQDLFGRGGAVQKIVPGDYGIVFQEHAIRKVTYVGPPTIFEIEEIVKDKGCLAPNSVCWQGKLIYFYSHDGFYVFDGESNPVPIGAEKVDRFIKDDFDTTDVNRMYGAIDRRNRAVFWLYPSRSTGQGRMLCYKPDVQRWSYIDVNAELIFEYATSAYDLDTIDALLTGGIDIDTFDMDDSPFKGGDVDFVAFGTDHKLASFSGTPLTATIETGEFSEFQRRVSVKSARPLTDGTVTVSAGTRDTQSVTYTYGAAQSRNAAGEANFRTSARYHRFKATISGGFTHAIGVDVIYRNEGRR